MTSNIIVSQSIAHIHHAWDTYNRYGMTTAALKRAILMMRMFCPVSVDHSLSINALLI